MSVVSRILKTRDLSTTLSVKGGDDGFLKGPLGYDFALVAYLWAMREKKNIDTMSADDCDSFVAGNEVDALITDKENDDIRRVMVQLGDGTCRRGDELTDDHLRKTATLLTVGCVKKEKNYNFVYDNAFDLQHIVHEHLLELWKTVYGLDKADPDFVKNLLDLHYQCNPSEKPQQTQTRPQQPAQPQQPFGASTDIQLDDTTGYLNLGKGIFVSRPDLLYQILSKFKTDQGGTAAIDKWAGLIADASHRAIGACVSAADGASDDEAADRKLLSLLGYKIESIDALFGKKSKDGSGDKDGSKDSDKKDAGGDKAAEEEFKTEPYRNKAFGKKTPKIDDAGDTATLEQLIYAMSAVKRVARDKNSSAAKKAKFEDAWSALCDIAEMIVDADRTDANVEFIHYYLAKAGVFKLEVENEGEVTPLCFSDDDAE